MNYYPFHMGDYATATRHLSWDEDAAYRRLLDAYYTREAPLPADMRQVFRLVIASSQEQREAVETVLHEFFEQTEDGWVNRRADREIDAMREKQQKQRDKANAMWEKRRAGTRQSQTTEHGNASAVPMHTETHAAASNADADAMPPTPTPTPTPTPLLLTTFVVDGGSPQSDAPPPPPSDQACLQIEIAGDPIVMNPQEGTKSGSGARNVGRLVPVPSPPPFDGENAEMLNGKAVVPLAAAWELPTQWGEDAEALGFKVADVIREAEKFRQYWVSGKGAGTRRNVKGWRQCWSNWLAKASERAQR